MGGFTQTFEIFQILKDCGAEVHLSRERAIVYATDPTAL